ncbi:MAG: RNA methyltransferase [Candidatus Marinimicrobia bacterium]|nr:RNA methyltransferase [Candidatus Neomarinimicrobiota bacterium]
MSLQKKKFRDSEQRFLIEGFLPLEEALRSSYRIREIFVVREISQEPHVSRLLLKAREGHHAACYEISRQELKRISCEQTPQGLVAVAEKKTFRAEALTGDLLLMDRIRDPGNAGTLFRIAHWFGLSGVLMMRGSVDACNPKTVRAGMGSVFHMPYLEIDTLPETLRSGRTLLLSKAHGNADIRDLRKEALQPFILVIGNESRGVSGAFDHYPHLDVTLPSLGGAESLNAAAAAAAILSRLLY